MPDDRHREHRDQHQPHAGIADRYAVSPTAGAGDARCVVPGLLTLVRCDGHLFLCPNHMAATVDVFGPDQPGERLNVGRYQINLDALLARIVYRWPLQVTALALLLIAVVGVTTGSIPPVWKGHAALAVLAAPGATVLLDGQRWPRAVYAGQHTLLASLPDGRSSWTTFTLRASEALTLTLPAGLSVPIERSLPPAAPGTHIEQVWW